MAKQPVTATPTDSPPDPIAADLDRLARYRLERDLTFDALAREMQRAGCRVTARALHAALTHRLTTVPRERTRFKIARFLDAVDARSRKRRDPAA